MANPRTAAMTRAGLRYDPEALSYFDALMGGRLIAGA